MDAGKPIGIPALVSLYEKLAAEQPASAPIEGLGGYRSESCQMFREMGRFFTSMSAALQLAADGRLSAGAALHQAEANIRHE